MNVPDMFTQVGVAPVQTVPHAPQWAAVLRASSQPVAGMSSQSPKPMLQVNPHTLLAQVVVALERAGQTVAHVPQLLTSLVVLISQPLVRLLASQSAKPTVQVPVQLPPEHAAAMLLPEHIPPVHDPHCVIEVLVSTSQPLLWRFMSQLARPAWQTPLQALAPQVRETTPVPEQMVPQAPHESGSEVRSRQTSEQLV